MFFGIPSRGLAIENLLTIVKEQPNKGFIEYLGSNSAFLAHHHNEFYSEFTFNDAQVVSVYEIRTTPTLEVCNLRMVSDFAHRLLVERWLMAKYRAGGGDGTAVVGNPPHTT
jgi:hypothetical protein